jgi:hypothetical protein
MPVIPVNKVVDDERITGKGAEEEKNWRLLTPLYLGTGVSPNNRQAPE